MTEKANSNPNPDNEHPVSTVEDTATSIVKKIGTFASLGIYNFRFLLIGSILANAIQWIQQVVLSWLAYDITGSGTVLGTVNLVASVASLIMIPFAGIIVDRMNRRRLLMIDAGWLFTITLGLGLLLVTGHSHIAFLFAFSFMFSLGQTIDMTLRQVVIFDLVPRNIVPNALALIQTGWSLMRVIGPSIGGFLIIWFAAGGSFLIQAGAYILIIMTILMMKFPPREPQKTKSSAIQNIRDGLRFVVTQRITRTFIVLGVIMPILAIPIFAILPPIYAVKVFGDSSGKILGFLMASVGIGGILGGVVTASLRRFDNWGMLQLGSLFFLSIALVAFAFCSYLPLAFLCMALAGFFEIIFLTTNQTIIQLSIPDNLRARVTAVINLVWILSPIGSMIAGAGSDLIGPKMITIVLASTGAVITVLVYILSPTVRNYRLSQGIESN